VTQITVNGEAREVPDGASVLALVELLGLEPRGLAVAVDRTVVPRQAWSTTTLQEDSRVELLVAAAGG
jgi:sulfur carrier protein